MRFNSLIAIATMLGAITFVATAAAQSAAPPLSAASSPAPRVQRPQVRPDGPMHGWNMNRENTPAIGMMSEAERKEHRQKMRSFKDRSECMAYMDQHHTRMTERAKERSRPMPDRPHQAPCARFDK